MWGHFLQDEMTSERAVGPGLAQMLVAYLYGIDVVELRASTRGDAKTARARQVTMYLIHVVYGLNLKEVGDTFGRDRTTASHACHHVEDLREDPTFDHRLALLENLLREAVQIGAMA